jgi:RHS repeat-associated protein
LNELTTYAGKSLSHDANGNVSAFGTDSYGYSSENLLTSATVGGVTTTLAYDPLLRLYQTVSGATTSKFAYDGLNALAEYNTAGTLQRRWAFDDAGQPVVQYEGTGTTSRYYLSADERGSIVSASNSSGGLTGINQYDEYGAPSALTGRFGYTGQAWLPSVKAWYYKARVYEPELGRFLQTDPVGYADSPNLYNYVLGDPVNLVDPLGLQACSGNSCPGPSSGNIIVPGTRPPGINPPSTTEPGPGRRPIPGFNPLPPGGSARAQTPTCRAISKAAEHGRSALPSWLTNTDRWNSPATLRGELAISQMNVSDAQAVAFLFGGYVSGLGQGAALGQLARRGVLSGLGSFGIGAALQGYGATANLAADYYQTQADAIQARLAQLQAQQDQTCPSQ